MSRTPVREAFLRLQSEGLLRLYPKRGALVVPVSVGEVEAVMETRMLVERFALDKVLANGPAPDIADAMATAIAAAGGVRRGRRRRRLRRPSTASSTRSFVTAAGNPIVTGLYDSCATASSG